MLEPRIFIDLEDQQIQALAEVFQVAHVAGALQARHRRRHLANRVAHELRKRGMSEMITWPWEPIAGEKRP